MKKKSFLNLHAKSDIINPIAGQALVELLVGIGIGVIIIGASTATIVSVVNSEIQTKYIQTASDLASGLMENTKIFGEANWFNIYNLNKGSTNHYFLSAAPFAATTGSETIVSGGVSYQRYFYIENVNRDTAGNINVSGSDDPSTQKITIVVTWPRNTSGISVQSYLTRSGRGIIFRQTDWSGGGGQAGPFTSTISTFATSTASVDFNSLPGSLKLILP